MISQDIVHPKDMCSLSENGCSYNQIDFLYSGLGLSHEKCTGVWSICERFSGQCQRHSLECHVKEVSLYLDYNYKSLKNFQEKDNYPCNSLPNWAQKFKAYPKGCNKFCFLLQLLGWLCNFFGPWNSKKIDISKGLKRVCILEFYFLLSLETMPHM